MGRQGCCYAPPDPCITRIRAVSVFSSISQQLLPVRRHITYSACDFPGQNPNGRREFGDHKIGSLLVADKVHQTVTSGVNREGLRSRGLELKIRTSKSEARVLYQELGLDMK